MTHEKKPSDPNPSADDKATAAPKITRRRFTKAGAVAPIVMTLSGRPAWGQTTCTPSGVGSLTYQSADPNYDPALCQVNCPPSTWSKNEALWKTDKYQPADEFGVVFIFSTNCPDPSQNPAKKNLSHLAGLSLRDILAGITNFPNNDPLPAKLVTVAQLAIAAVLNAAYNVYLNEDLALLNAGVESFYPLKDSVIQSGLTTYLNLYCSTGSEEHLQSFIDRIRNATSAFSCFLPT
jgi:hypothetical protein